MPQYQQPPTKSAVITPTYVKPVETNNFGKEQFGVKIEGKDGDVWFNCSHIGLYDQFKADHQTAIEYYRTQAGNLKIAHAEAVGWEPEVSQYDPRINPPEDMLATAKPKAFNGKSEVERTSIEKQVLVKAASIALPLHQEHPGMSAHDVAEWVNEAWELIFAPPKPATPEQMDELEQATEKVEKVFAGSTKLPDDDNEEEFGF